jgi:CheY-like chemotaxis protein
MFRILLAEDEQVMRAYLARALERSGYEVVAVDSGTAAAPLLQAERFDLLLTDIIMPPTSYSLTDFPALPCAPGRQYQMPRFSPNPSISRIWFWRSSGCLPRKAVTN